VTAIGVAVVDHVELLFGLGTGFGSLLLERLEPILALLGVLERLLVAVLVEVSVLGARGVDAVEIAGVLFFGSGVRV
jgi:hypothetical protein